jgi:hypothetical protein
MNYWQLIPNMLTGCWVLGSLRDESGQPVDERLFIRGEKVELNGALLFSVSLEGRPVDYTRAIFNVPVVRPRVADLIEAQGPNQIQRIAVQVDGHAEPFEIVNILRKLDCIDTTITKIRTWTRAEIPRLEGTYKAVDWLRIDREKARGAHIFRIDEWPIPVIVSQQMRESFEEAGITGITYEAR